MRQRTEIGFYYVYFNEPAYRWPFSQRADVWYYMAYYDIHTFKQG